MKPYKSEFLRILKPSGRVWIKPLKKFRINISYETGVEISPRTIEVAEAFGLGLDKQEKFVIYDNVQLEIRKKDVVYITGESGSGKSVLLRFLAAQLGKQAVNLADIQPNADKSLIDCVGKTTA